ncbi:hypothetical protein QBC36DRAFT_355126 [Triangularia setosa]|uniref:Uncharacterized protein n=1 Tax=Triangularia setosa TaxID=2587417 RepID=A0AAN6WFW7_9PEZI|nr:hypothetical protein QBC36DRAFT_355126 [Podospora setosa]
MRVAVVGAGPSGLMTFKYLLAACDFLATDPESVGGTFAHRTYEDGELVSSKQLTTFSGFRLRVSDPDFLSTDRYVQYLSGYCTHFGLWKHIKLSTTVLSIRQRGNRSTHIITYQHRGSPQTQEYECDAVAICSGLHVTPNIPNIKGMAQFKERSQFGVGKTVLILGSGETAMDLGYFAMQCPTKRVLMSHRDGFLCAPKRVPDPVILPILGNKPDPNRLNVPIDSSSASLFDTAYVHRRLRDHMLLWHYYDVFIKSTLWLVGGSKYGMAHWVGGISDKRYHASKIFFSKSNKAIPYLSALYRQERESSFIQRIRSSLIQVPVADTHGRHIGMAPWPSHVDEHGVVHFQNNGRPECHLLKNDKVKPDMVIFATGYTQTFPFLPGNYPTSETLDTRSTWHSSDLSTGFIGFGANHESYAYQLAIDMGAAPGFWEVLFRDGGWYKLPLLWALGANFNAKFRIGGPWKWEGAEEVLVEELWDTVARRGGFFGRVTLSGLPMAMFGSINLVLWVLDPVIKVCEMVVSSQDLHTWVCLRTVEMGRTAEPLSHKPLNP